MARMWHPPTAEMKMANGDPLYAAIARRCGQLAVNFTTDHTGCAAIAYSVRRHNGDWYRHELGAVEGSTPLGTALAVAHEFTALDADLLKQHLEYIERLAEDFGDDALSLMNAIHVQADDLAEVLSNVRA